MRERLWAAGALGGVGALAVLAIVVLRFGIINPSPPSMQEVRNEAIAGMIAFADEDGCYHVIDAAGGEPRQVTCGLKNFGGDLTWVDAEHIAFAIYTGSGVTWRSVDVATGEEADLGTTSGPGGLEADDMVSPLGERLIIDYPGGDVYRVDGPDRVRIFDYDGPDSWTPEYITWSPDGEWVLLRYGKEGELWVVRRDGSFSGTLVDDVAFGRPSWWMDELGALPEVELPEGDS